MIALALGWRPARRPALGWAVLLVLLGARRSPALGLLLAGTLRAEATLAAANLVWLLLLLVGGIVVPLAQLPGRWPRSARCCPPVRWPRGCGSR